MGSLYCKATSPQVQAQPGGAGRASRRGHWRACIWAQPEFAPEAWMRRASSGSPEVVAMLGKPP